MTRPLHTDAWPASQAVRQLDACGTGGAANCLRMPCLRTRRRDASRSRCCVSQKSASLVQHLFTGAREINSQPFIWREAGTLPDQHADERSGLIRELTISRLGADCRRIRFVSHARSLGPTDADSRCLVKRCRDRRMMESDKIILMIRDSLSVWTGC